MMMMVKPWPPAFTSIRFYSRSTEKQPLKLVAELRKLTDVSITKAREALVASNNDPSAALQWLQNDLASSGAKKAAKVAHRAAGEGLVGASVLSRGTGSGSSSSSPGNGDGGVRAALVELNCETDFVARNALFGRLVADVAHTAAFLAESEPPLDGGQVEEGRGHSKTHMHMRPFPRELLLDAPLLSADAAAVEVPRIMAGTTVRSAIRDAISKLGENVVLQRAVSVVHDDPGSHTHTRGHLGLRIASYTHGGVSHSQGRIGALALVALKSPRLAMLLSTVDFREGLERVERSLVRQIVGFDTQAIRGGEGALYDQPFMMFGDALEGETVGAGLARWAREKQLVLDTDGTDPSGLEVVEFVRWTVGESSDAV